VDQPVRADVTTVERVEDIEAFRGLRKTWNDLLADSGAARPFLTWEWLFTWWKHLADGRRLRLLLVRRRGELIAIAPLCSRRRGLSGLLALPSLEFLGAGDVGSDYLDLIVRRGREEIAVRAIAEELEGEDVVLEFRRLARRDSVAGTLAGQLRQRGWAQSASAPDVCPFIRLSGHSWESYLTSLGPRHRYNFRRRLRGLMRRFDVRLCRARSGEERRDAFERLVAMHNLRWSGRGGSTALHRPALVSFHREAIEEISEQGWLRLLILRLDGRPVAILYGFLYRRVFYFYQSGFDLAFHKDSVGLVTLGLAIQSAIEEGAEEFDLLHGSESYKYQWTGEARELERVELYPPHARGVLSRAATDLGRNVRGMARRLLPGPAVSADPGWETKVDADA